MKNNNLKTLTTTFLFLLVFSTVLQSMPTKEQASSVDSSLISSDTAAKFAFSPRGDFFASVDSYDGLIKLLDLSNGVQRAALPFDVNDKVTSLAFNPNGENLAIAGKNGVTLWEHVTGTQRLFSTGESLITKLVFSPDSKKMAGIDDQRRILVWDVSSAVQKWVQAVAENVTLTSIAFSPDGGILAGSDSDGHVKLWDSSTGNQLASINSPSAAGITNLTFSAQGWLAAIDGQSNIVILDTASGYQQQLLKQLQGQVKTFALSPNGTKLASSGVAARIKLWDVGMEQLSAAADGSQVNKSTIEPANAATGLLFNNDGTLLASIGKDPIIELWNVENGELEQTLIGHWDRVSGLAFNRNHQTLASIGYDGQLIIWDLTTGEELYTNQIFDTIARAPESQRGITSSTVPKTSDTTTAATRTTKSGIRVDAILQSSDGDIPVSKAYGRHAVNALDMSPNGKMYCSGHRDGKIRIWNAAGEELAVLEGHDGIDVTGVLFYADNKVASVSDDSTIRLWDLKTNKLLQTLHGHEHPVKSIAGSPDGKLIASAGEAPRILLWDSKTGELLNILYKHRDFVTSLVFSPDGQRLVSGDGEGSMLVWDVKKGTLIKTLPGHTGAINTLAFSNDSSIVISGGEDTFVKVWNIETGEEKLNLVGYDEAIQSVKVDSTGKILVTAGKGGKILQWNLHTGQLVKDLSINSADINAVEFKSDGDIIIGDEQGEIHQMEVKEKPSPQPPLSQVPRQGDNATAVQAVERASLVSVGEDFIAKAKTSTGELFGNLLDWLVPAAAAALPDPNKGPGGPILVITSGSSKYSKYFAEILRTEGLNAFSVTDISNISSGLLANYDVVIVGAMPLTSTHATQLSNWVKAGGHLIAMRPDQRLSSLLGIKLSSGTITDGYLLVNTSAAPGRGIVNKTIQFHGTADRYTLNGATMIARLYTSASASTSFPAVTLRNVGSKGGKAAAFTYDLATSIVYSRQGNPVWATDERDGFSPKRPNDKFYGNKAGDKKKDWIDLNKVAIPQADEQQRLLANLIIEMNLDKRPLPRFWYFPRGEKAVVIMTGDNHGNNGVEGRFNRFLQRSPSGCSVANWECVRGTAYVYTKNPLTAAKAKSFSDKGFEIGLHINTNCGNFTPSSLNTFYSQQVSKFTSKYFNLPAPATQRQHCLAWSDWASSAKTQLKYGMRLDTTYYFWPPKWVANKPGFFTGSGMPMRFADLDGKIIDVYKATSQMTDESGQQYPFTINTLLDRALGSTGYYGAFTINAHTDVVFSDPAEKVVTSALARSVPIITSKQMLTWLDGRNSSSFQSITWNGKTLSFKVQRGNGANGLQGLIPLTSATGNTLKTLKLNGKTRSFSTENIKGIAYAKFSAAAGSYVATYASGGTTPPPVPAICPCSIWDNADTPADPTDPDISSVELGARFKSNTDGFVSAVRFYKAGKNNGKHIGSLWTAAGKKLASVTFTGETSSGWQQANFAKPVAITKNTVYVISYFAPNGGYASDENYFANSGVINGPLEFLKNGDNGSNGVYKYASSSSFPSNSFKSTNYWVDLVFDTTKDGDNTAPLVSSTVPSSGANGINKSSVVTATFNEQMNPTTITTSSVQLKIGGNFVPSSVDYNASNRTLALTPNSSLAAATTYTAIIKGGSAGVKDLAGNPLAQDYTWNFTTANDGSVCNPCSGWDKSTIPANPSESDASSVEIGVKFRTDVDGFITGISFYKGAGNTGTHIGNLWSETGKLLATATFTGETNIGWQQVKFSSPVPVFKNKVYTASYFAKNGRYAADAFFFSNKGQDNGPLRLLQDGVSGGNGVYAYGSSSSFPKSSYKATNYYVDVEFTFGNQTCDEISIWSNADVPANPSENDNNAVELGVKFSSDVDGYIKAIRFYKGSANIGTHKGTLWSSSGQLLATATFTGETNSGWQQVNFSAPVPIKKNTVYIASYHAPNGKYSNDRFFFANNGISNGTLRFLQDGDSGGNGVYQYNSSSSFPQFTYKSSNYWVDVLFSTNGSLVCGNPGEAIGLTIAEENTLPGNPSSEWDINGAGDSSIQGFSTDISVNRGQKVAFKIDTNATNYKLNIYRMGYYAGKGARKITTVLPAVALPQKQPACLNDAKTGLLDCGNWKESASWNVPADATSGIYFAKVIRTDTGGASHIVFIVRDDASQSDILFQTSDTTWQAYNTYGGNSFYRGSPAGRAYKLSYNRPFNTRSNDNGADWLFNAEYPMVRWLEANGYDVTYTTGVDTDRRGNLVMNHNAFLSVGHDEYWSKTQRDNIEAARAAGIHLAFFSGNEVFWKTRWENSIDGSGTPYRTLVSYKETHANKVIDPKNPIWTGTWRDPRFSPPADGGRPENALTGTIFMVNAPATTSIKVPEPEGKMRFWRNTSVAKLTPGTTATLPFGTLGYEWNEDLDNGFRPAGLIRISSTTVNNVPLMQDFGSKYSSGTATHNLTLYRHNSGALVFGAGTIQWSWGLDSNHDRGNVAADARMQQATVNLFADMRIQPVTLQAGLKIATASSDAIKPTSQISSPSNGAVLQAGTAVTITGTANDTGGGRVGGVEVSVDGGISWHPANGRTNWSYVWTPTAAANVTIKSRTADDSGNIELPGTGINVTVGSPPANECPCYLWDKTAVPNKLSEADTSAVELGVKFMADSDGLITSILFYKGNANIGTHVGKLWDNNGNLLAQKIFTNETASGWQQVDLDQPVPIKANKIYVASYHTNVGRYSLNEPYFSAGSVKNGPLTALSDGASGGNGVYLYGSGGFPSKTFNSSNYWVDVEFVPN
jgi:WD40 repeat protein